MAQKSSCPHNYFAGTRACKLLRCHPAWYIVPTQCIHGNKSALFIHLQNTAASPDMESGSDMAGTFSYMLILITEYPLRLAYLISSLKISLLLRVQWFSSAAGNLPDSSARPQEPIPICFSYRLSTISGSLWHPAKGTYSPSQVSLYIYTIDIRQSQDKNYKPTEGLSIFWKHGWLLSQPSASHFIFHLIY